MARTKALISVGIALAALLTATTPVALSAAKETAAAQNSFLTLEQLKARYGQDGSRYAAIGGMAIRYKDEGTGPAVVLLHGSHSSLDGYDGLAAALKADHRVIRFDMPGMGLSEGLPAGAATDTPFADDILKTLLDQLGVPRAVLVGVSSGGAMAYYFASRFPDRVEALVLANTPSEPVIAANTPRTPELRTEFEQAEKSGFRSRRYWAVYLDWLTGEKSRLSEAKTDRYYDMNRRVPLAGGQRLFWRSTGNVPDVYRTLSTVATPTLLVWGKIDFVLPIHTLDGLKAKMPAANVSTIILPDVGHYPPFEVPQRFAGIVRTFTTQVVLQK